MALWESVLTHGTTSAGAIIAGVWFLRCSSNAILRLVAGLVAIFAHDERPRAARALEVLYTLASRREERNDVLDHHEAISGASARGLPEGDEADALKSSGCIAELSRS
jgi:hypothetical protein